MTFHLDPLLSLVGVGALLIALLMVLRGRFWPTQVWLAIGIGFLAAVADLAASQVIGIAAFPAMVIVALVVAGHRKILR